MTTLFVAGGGCACRRCGRSSPVMVIVIVCFLFYVSTDCLFTAMSRSDLARDPLTASHPVSALTSSHGSTPRLLCRLLHLTVFTSCSPTNNTDSSSSAVDPSVPSLDGFGLLVVHCNLVGNSIPASTPRYPSLLSAHTSLTHCTSILYLPCRLL